LEVARYLIGTEEFGVSRKDLVCTRHISCLLVCIVHTLYSSDLLLESLRSCCVIFAFGDDLEGVLQLSRYVDTAHPSWICK